MRAIQLLMVFFVVSSVGCKTAELAVIHPTTGINLVARFEAKDETAHKAVDPVKIADPVKAASPMIVRSQRSN